jgi:hypothetical protein
MIHPSSRFDVIITDNFNTNQLPYIVVASCYIHYDISNFQYAFHYFESTNQGTSLHFQHQLFNIVQIQVLKHL